MFEQLLLLALQYSAVCGVVMVLMHVVGTNAYDLSVFKRRHSKNMLPVRYEKKQKLLTVLIRTHNHETTIEECLRSLFIEFHHPIEIIVIDDRSHDSTRKIVTQFKDNHPSERITLFAKRHRTVKRRQLEDGYKKYGHGDNILTIEGNNIVSGQAISKAYDILGYDSTLTVIKPHIVIQSDYFLASLFQKYRSILSIKAKKLASITNTDFEVADVAFYRKDEFNRVFKGSRHREPNHLPNIRSGNKLFRYQYCNEIVVYALPQRSVPEFYREAYREQVERTLVLLANLRLLFNRSKDYSRFLTWFRIPVNFVLGGASLLLPLVLTYFIYLSVRLHEPLFLLLSVASFSMLLLYAVWGDDSLGTRQKCYYSFGIPLSFLAYYGLTIIQSIAILFGLLQTGAQYL